MEIVNVLKEFGMSDNEIQVYTILLKFGSVTAGEIASKSKVHRINVYDILERLQERGLVSYVMIGKTKYYEAAHPKKLLQIQEDRKESLKQILPKLEGFQKLGKYPQDATIYKDLAGIKNVIDNHTNSKTPVYLFGSGWGFKEFFPHYFEIYHSRLERNKIKVKVLLSKGVKKTDLKLPKLYDARYLPLDMLFPSSTAVYEDKVLMIMWSSHPIAILIRGKEVSDSYKKYFEVLWEQAKS